MRGERPSATGETVLRSGLHHSGILRGQINADGLPRLDDSAILVVDDYSRYPP